MTIKYGWVTCLAIAEEKLKQLDLNIYRRKKEKKWITLDFSYDETHLPGDTVLHKIRELLLKISGTYSIGYGWDEPINRRQDDQDLY